MALPSSGSISMGQVRTELKKSGSLDLNNSDVRRLAGKPSGTIRMSDLRGKSNKKWVYITTAKGEYSSNKGASRTIRERALSRLESDVQNKIGVSYDFHDYLDGEKLYNGYEHQFLNKYKIIFTNVYNSSSKSLYEGDIYELK